VKSWAVAFTALSLAVTGHACGGEGLVPDASPSAITAGDFTALIEIEGCGFQPQVQEGYAYCRVTEGPVGTLSVTFVAPPQAAHCKQAPCVDFTLFYPDQSPAYQGQIPFGETSVQVPWSTLTHKTVFSPDDTGFWLYTYTIRWLDDQGREQKTVADGEIRLRVVRAQVCADGKCQAYVPLRNAVADPNFVWQWTHGPQTIRMTTGARTYVSF
jgi:hypothetical protein